MSTAATKKGAAVKNVNDDEDIKELDRLLNTLSPEELEALETELIDIDVR